MFLTRDSLLRIQTLQWWPRTLYDDLYDAKYWQTSKPTCMFPEVPDEDLDRVSEVLEASEVSEVSVVSADDDIMAPLTKVQLSPFWPNNAAVWFVRADQEFVIKSVTVQATKYAYLVAFN